jgi:cystathionine beta-lyase/cystathionine gamma-synthase
VAQVTKYLAGHSDVLAGVVVAAGASAEGTARWHTRADAALDPRASPSQPAAEAGAAAAAEAEAASVDIPSTEKAGDSAAIGWWSRVRSVQRAGGGVAGPFECFLALRGLRTLGVRVRQQCHNAMALATALEAHPGVDAVFYPGLESHPQHELAKTALFASTASGDGAQVLFGAMLSVRIAGGEEAALRVASALRVFHTATSLGGTESLVEHRATIEPAGTKTPRDLLRVSIGLEPASVLVHDWMTALGKERTLG